MSTNAQPLASRRQALALSAALAATVLTALVAIGGLTHKTAARPAPPARIVVVRPAAPAVAPAPVQVPVARWADD